MKLKSSSRNRTIDLFPRSPDWPSTEKYQRAASSSAQRIPRSFSCEFIAQARRFCTASAPLAGNRSGCPTIGALRNAAQQFRSFFPLRRDANFQLRQLLALNAGAGEVGSSKFLNICNYLVASIEDPGRVTTTI